MTEKMARQELVIFILLFSRLPSYNRLCIKTVSRGGGGRHEGLVPTNNVLISGFIGFSLARTLARILFCTSPLLPLKLRRRCEEGHSEQFTLFEAIRS